MLDIDIGVRDRVMNKIDMFQWVNLLVVLFDIGKLIYKGFVLIFI